MTKVKDASGKTMHISIKDASDLIDRVFKK